MRNQSTPQEELEKRAKVEPGRTAISDERTELTFEDLDRRSDAVANALQKQGLSPGDVVPVLMSNRLEWAEILYGCFKAGVLPAGINFHFTPEQVKETVRSVDVGLFVFESEFRDMIDPIRDQLGLVLDDYIELDGDRLSDAEDGYRPYEEFVGDGINSQGTSKDMATDDDALVWYTSGTTGDPKPVVWKMDDLLNAFIVLGSGPGLQFDESDRALLLMPFFHGNSQMFLMTLLYSGASVHVHTARGFDPDETLSLIDRESITFTSMVPTHYNGMIYNSNPAGFDLSTLRSVLSSSSPLSQDLKEKIIETFDCDVYEGYGAVEAGLGIILQPEHQLKKIGSVGRPLPGHGLLVLDDSTYKPVEAGEVGEIFLQSPWAMDRYYDMPEETEAVELHRDDKRWITVGDMGRVDEEGFLYLVNRKDDMIVSGGENIYPTPIEEVLHRHDGMRDVAVVGVPNEKWGEAVHAEVITTEESNPPTQELIEFCQGKVADYEVPKSVTIVDEMPRTSTGKILRRKIREKYWNGDGEISEQ